MTRAFHAFNRRKLALVAEDEMPTKDYGFTLAEMDAMRKKPRGRA